MKKESFRLEDCEHMICETLKRGGTFRFYPKGTSMLPFIRQEHDMVVLSPLPENLRCYQTVLYKRENGAFVLHRIVRVGADSYTMRGDNQFYNEPGIRKEQMIGLVTEIIRDGRKTDTSSFGEKAAVMIWVKTAWIRRKCRLFDKIVRKIIKH